MAYKIDPRDLIKVGAHFGHNTSRWHPKMEKYIYTKKNGIHIIDLTLTAEMLEQALEFIEKTASTGKKVLLVGTKRQSKSIINEAATKTDSPYVVNRWPGGLLTNRETMNSRISKLKKLENQMASGEIVARYNKLEVQRIQEEIDGMNYLYGGIKELEGQPGAVFVADAQVDSLAIREAQKLKIPIIAIVDTNSDPTGIDYPVPANDDAIKTIQFVVDQVVSAIENGKSKIKQKPHEGDKK